MYSAKIRAYSAALAEYVLFSAAEYVLFGRPGSEQKDNGSGTEAFTLGKARRGPGALLGHRQLQNKKK